MADFLQFVGLFIFEIGFFVTLFRKIWRGSANHKWKPKLGDMGHIMFLRELQQHKDRIVENLRPDERLATAWAQGLALGTETLLSATNVLRQTGKRALRYGAAIKLRQLVLQTGIYCLVIGLAVGFTSMGSKIMFGLIHHEMSEMGAEVAFTHLPVEVETASIRSTIRQ